jgi:hypothetical protein
MLNTEIIKKIEDFVYKKPRSVDEIAKYINKNWRTADRYINEIQKNFGTISTRVFREGTRGALKIIYWSSIEKISNSIFQENLEKEIINAKRKEDFSAFDIFQLVDGKNKKVTLEHSSDENHTNLKELAEIIRETEKQLLVFSGNLSFINLENKDINLFKEIDNLVKKGVSIKVICRVDIAGIGNIEKILSLNHKYGKELIEIRHKDHPLRALIVDKKIFRIKEIKEPTGKIKELDKKIFIFYTIKDKEWIEWLFNIFWKMFNNSVSAEKRLEELRKLRY